MSSKVAHSALGFGPRTEQNLTVRGTRLAALLLLLLAVLPVGAERRDSIAVSLIACWPGPEVYELCGHEAIRIRGLDQSNMELDTVWNYGVFDFAQPNFLYRFVKGETDYMLWGYPTRMFMGEYQFQGRRVMEQELNLSQEEAHRLLDMLREEARPENRTYRYNYVKDNCATRIVDRLDRVSTRRVVYPDTVRYGTFRDEMRAFHRDYPWYQFGIDLALGSGIDYPVDGRAEMFAPVEMYDRVAKAHFDDGTPLVRETRVLNEGKPDATLGPSHWSTWPIVTCSLFLICVLGVCWLQYRRNLIYRAVYSVWFGVLGLAGLLVTFLVFISSHEATSPNLMLLWLNPLQLIFALGVWFSRKWRIPNAVVVYYNITALTVMPIVWPWQRQSANPAFFPLIGATLAMAVTYAIITQKKSYNKESNTLRHEEVGNLGAGRSDRAKRGRADGSRKATARGRNRR